MSAARTQLRLPIDRFPRSVRRLLRSGRTQPALLGMVLVAGMVAMSCSSGGGEQKAAERAPVPVRVTKVGKGDIAVTLSYSGELRSVDSVDLLPTATGRVEDKIGRAHV